MTFDTPLTEQQLREIAHELRAPLGGIEAMIEMLARSPLDAEQGRIVEALAASAAHLRSIAGQVLGNGDVSEAPHGNQACLASIETAARARAAARALDFRLVVLNPEICDEVTDTSALRQVIENLIDNAFRLTESGSVELMLTRAGRDRVRVSVTDTGPGISTEDANRLIRDGGGISGRTGGAGIGLTIAGRLVVARGGSLQGGPAPGGGACFTFDWPLRMAGLGRPVLIVDDHHASRTVLSTILRASGHVCIEAASIGEAETLLASHRPGLVLTDLHMPEGGGESLVRAIMAMPLPARPKVILVTADDIDAGNPLAAMVDRIVRKPISVRSVLDAVAGAERAQRADAA